MELRLDGITKRFPGGVVANDEVDLQQRLRSFGERQHRGPSKIALQHDGASKEGELHTGSLGHGGGDHPLESSLAEVADDYPTDEFVFDLGCPAEEICQQLGPGCCRSGARRRFEHGEQSIEIGHHKARLGGRDRVELGDRGPTNADRPLAGRTEEEADGRLDVRGVDVGQHGGQECGLLLAAPGGGDGDRRFSQTNEQHRVSIVSSGPPATPARPGWSREANMSDEAKITSRPNGPLMVSGGVPLVRKTAVHSEHGEPLTWKTSEPLTDRGGYALCRCGSSANKPFCDGAHSKIDFSAP